MQRFIRGATTALNNDKAEILEATRELIERVISENSLDISQITTITFTCTRDLDQVYPAVAARELGIVHAALMCIAELYIEGSLPKCIRLMMGVDSDVSQAMVKHVYLRGAAVLRPDITGGTQSKPFQIAIDGPSGVGKSTVAKLCAAKLGFSYVDTGAMYRAFAYYFMIRSVDVSDEVTIINTLDSLPMEVKFENGAQVIYLEGRAVSDELRSQDVVLYTSKIAKIPAVRQKLVAIQREIAEKASVIMDGRDIGTVVLKDSPLKIYLDASAEIRTKRRVSELERLGHKPDFDTVLKEVMDRDYADMNRENDPLKKADDAVEIICDNMDAYEVCAVVCAMARQRMNS